jgi:uncharacterized PurR-regulated membrane protein YhhQ (DUF165 family)
LLWHVNNLTVCSTKIQKRSVSTKEAIKVVNVSMFSHILALFSLDIEFFFQISLFAHNNEKENA